MNNSSFVSTPRLWRYQLALMLAPLPLFCYTLWQAISLRQMRYLKQRSGFAYPARAANSAQPVWLHAASVGEVLAAEPLLRALHRENPNLPLIITTMTPTGAQIARQRFTGFASHCYLPVDWHGATRRFLKSVQPRCALIMETELWPNLYTACGQRGINPVMVNGRISPRTLNTGTWVRQLYQATLQQVSVVLARSEQDADRFIELGAKPEQVKLIGNIKFASTPENTGAKPVSLPRPFVLVASTHEDEELQIAKLWHAKKFHNMLLVIIPRHPKRSSAIVSQLQGLSLSIAVRSRNEEIEADTDVYLADTLGELPAFCSAAELVIMGGSFVPVGGHNMLEPAVLGKAILFGPHMHNFADEAEGLLAQQAAIQIDSYERLGEEVNRLLVDPARRKALGERAQLFMHQNRNIAERYLLEIASACPAAKILPDQS